MSLVAFEGRLVPGYAKDFWPLFKPVYLFWMPWFWALLIGISASRNLTHGTRTLKVEHGLLVLLAVGSYLGAYLAARRRFSRWWRSTTEYFQNGISGTVAPEGLLVHGASSPVPLTSFARIELSRRAAIFTFPNGTGLPVHHEMVSGNGWQNLVATVHDVRKPSKPTV